MAPVPFRNIESVSSEDDSNPASNLLEMGSGKKWLCSRENKSGKAEVVLMLSKKTRIASIDICNFGSAFVEISVGNSDTPDEFITLLPSSMMMSPADSKAGRSKTRTKMFPKERLSAAAVSKKWNIVKVKCVQMYNLETQFGLQYVAIYTESHNHSTPSTVATSNATTNHLLSSSASQSPLTPQTNHTSTPHIKHLSTPGLMSKTAKTPKRLSKMRKSEDDDDFEFSGVEKQSRLFRYCIRDKSEQQSNPILERVRNKFQKENTNSTKTSSLYERKKLLKTELPRAELAVDFMSGYTDSKKQDFNVTSAFSRMASHDNDYEIGEEPEVKWGWNRFRGKPSGKRQKRDSSSNQGINGSPREWLGKKRKRLDIMISECHAILDKVSSDPIRRSNNEANTTTDDQRDEEMVDDIDCYTTAKNVQEYTVETDTVEYEGKKIDNTISSGEEPMASLIECPLCSELFPSYIIDLHASSCGEEDPVISRAPIVID